MNDFINMGELIAGTINFPVVGIAGVRKAFWRCLGDFVREKRWMIWMNLPPSFRQQKHRFKV